MAGRGFLRQRDFCLLYCKAAVLLETTGQQRDAYREGRDHEKQSGQYPGAGGAFRDGKSPAGCRAGGAVKMEAVPGCYGCCEEML